MTEVLTFGEAKQKIHLSDRKAEQISLGTP